MAERRMFAKSIVLSDAFLDMPMSSRCLYFTLGMLADDDGFVGNPKSIMRQCGATNDDMKVLLSKRYVLGFDSGVIIIKHWRMNNYLQNDRHKSTTYLEELSTLTIDEKGSYTEKNKECIQPVYELDTQISIDKNSIDKNNNNARFTRPTIEEVRSYCKERNNSVDAERFFNYYESNGWKVGRNSMKDWRACIRTWERNNLSSGKKEDIIPVYDTSKNPEFDEEEFNRIMAKRKEIA